MIIEINNLTLFYKSVSRRVKARDYRFARFYVISVIYKLETRHIILKREIFYKVINYKNGGRRCQIQ